MNFLNVMSYIHSWMMERVTRPEDLNSVKLTIDVPHRMGPTVLGSLRREFGSLLVQPDGEITFDQPTPIYGIEVTFRLVTHVRVTETEST